MTAPKPTASAADPVFATFTFEGAKYTIPEADEWSLDALEAYEDGKVATLIREILGAAQWATFKSKPRTVADLTALFEAAQVAMSAGN